MKNLILFMAFFAFLSMALQSQNDQTNQTNKTVAVNTVDCQSFAKTTPKPEAKCGDFSATSFQKYCQPSTRLCKKQATTPSCRPAAAVAQSQNQNQSQTEVKKSVTEASFSGSLAALCAPFCPPGCCSLPCNTKTQKSEEVKADATELVAK